MHFVVNLVDIQILSEFLVVIGSELYRRWQNFRDALTSKDMVALLRWLRVFLKILRSLFLQQITLRGSIYLMRVRFYFIGVFDSHHRVCQLKILSLLVKIGGMRRLKAYL